MEYKKGEINGQMVFSQWLLITFTHQGKCIARDRSGGPLLGSRARLQIPNNWQEAKSSCPALYKRVLSKADPCECGLGGSKAMAKVIEFYVPDKFRRRSKWILPKQRGKVIQFPALQKKSA